MKKISILLLAIFITILSTTNVFAEQTTTITSDNTTMTIHRKVNNVTNPVTNTFTYTITADANNPSTVTGLPAANATTVVLTNAQPDSNHIAGGTGTLDLSNVVFDKLGVYKFIVTETGSINPSGNTDNSTTYPIDPEIYYVYVTVKNELNNNVPTGNFLADLEVWAERDSDGEKVDMYFESDTVLTHIELSKNVRGDLADINEYFEFSLNIPGTAGHIYKINGAHSTDGTTEVSTSNYVVGTTEKIYLKHGQSVTIGVDTIGTNTTVNQIPIGTVVSVTENGATDYTTHVNGVSGKTTGNETLVAEGNSRFSDDNVFAFINEKNSQTLTGLFFNIFPFVILLALGTFGVYYIKKSSSEN